MTRTRTLSLRITEEAIEEFARLTGDQSSLHTDSTFARRSIYRRKVVHGMLPVMALPFALAVDRSELRSVTRIAARFLNPVFIGDDLSLHSTDQGNGEWSFSIFRADSGREVTAGVLTLGAPMVSVTHGSPSTDLTMVRHVHEDDVDLESIDRGDLAELHFALPASPGRTLGSLVRRLTADPNEPAADAASFLAVAMLSTFVGMVRPGRRATFLEFSLGFDGTPAAETESRLTGTVAFISPSTRTLVETMTIDQDGRTIAEGKVKTRVNEGPRSMPSVTDLQERRSEGGLEGKVALVTGASRGLGETIAKALAVRGALVAVNYHRGAEDAQRVVSEIESAGIRAMAIQADVSKEDQVEAMFTQIAETLGQVDILVNNAVRDYFSSPWENLLWADVEADLDVILKGAFLCCRQATVHMSFRDGGRIITVGTTATDDPPPGHAKYVIAKSALMGLTRALAVELAPLGITVNAVCPSMMDTDLTAGVSAVVRSQAAARPPLGRLAKPADVADVVAFLASREAGFVTGQRIMVTGGQPPLL